MGLFFYTTHVFNKTQLFYFQMDTCPVVIAQTPATLVADGSGYRKWMDG